MFNLIHSRDVRPAIVDLYILPALWLSEAEKLLVGVVLVVAKYFSLNKMLFF
jgi:hypothetical protein